MDDYLTSVAEAVRSACFEACNENGGDMGAICTVDLPAVIASVPRPEPVFYALIDGEETQFNGKNAFSRGRTGGQPLYAEPVAAQPAVPVGYDPKEIDNVFSTLRYVIGLNPGKKAPTAHCQDIIERVASWSDMGKFHPMYSQYRAAAADRAMLAAAPVAPQTADDAATLRSAIRDMASMLQAREWAEHVSTDPDVTDLEVQVTELAGTATTLREQNAALVAELKAIDDLTGRAGFEFGGPLAIAIKEGLGDRGEFFELACIAGGYFEAISKHTDNALSSAKGNKA